MIHQLDINGRDKVEKAIMRLQAYEPEEGYFLCFSGGKDSCVIKALAEKLESEGVTYEDLVQIQEEVKAEVIAELEGADDEH